MSGALREQNLDARFAAPLGKVALVVPCHNEAAALTHLKAALSRLREHVDLELLLIDDASTDDTAALMETLFADWRDVMIVRHDTRCGIAGAISSGLERATAEVVASIDADCTYEPSTLLPMLQLLTPDVDLVVASPYHPDGQVQGVPRWRLFISQLASRLYRLVMRNKLHTYTSCVRVYRRRAVAGLPIRNQGFVGIVELLWQLDCRGGRIVEHPAVLRTRTAGKSKMRVARATLAHLVLLSRAAASRLVYGRGFALGTQRSPAPAVVQLAEE